QGTATLIGDPPSMLLGGFAKMNFMDFFFYHGRPGIFFAVELGAIVSSAVLYFIFRHHREKVQLIPVEAVRSWVPTGILATLIVALALSSFADTGFSYLAGIICMIFGIIALLWERFVNRASIVEGLKSLDWETTFFLMGVFILVGSITATGCIEVISRANIVACGILKKEGYTVRFGEFMRIGVPFTLAAVTAAYLFVWWIWGP
ncbi:MAG: arsenic transporter, partial [Candidatus Aureabacteria bacterium]|nr:arsenic transporter [Candidatus Auribacterota bacterium]